MDNDELNRLRKFFRDSMSQRADAFFLRGRSMLVAGNGLTLLGTSKRFPPQLIIDAFMKHRKN